MTFSIFMHIMYIVHDKIHDHHHYSLWFTFFLEVKLPYEPVCPFVGASVIISYKGGKFHFHAPNGAV